jgi:hypothetical protein
MKWHKTIIGAAKDNTFKTPTHTHASVDKLEEREKRNARISSSVLGVLLADVQQNQQQPFECFFSFSSVCFLLRVATIFTCIAIMWDK